MIRPRTVTLAAGLLTLLVTVGCQPIGRPIVPVFLRRPGYRAGGPASHDRSGGAEDGPRGTGGSLGRDRKLDVG